ncbi:hypothetical protein MC885_012387, partial [Smutsia gigantea]
EVRIKCWRLARAQVREAAAGAGRGSTGSARGSRTAERSSGGAGGPERGARALASPGTFPLRARAAPSWSIRRVPGTVDRRLAALRAAGSHAPPPGGGESDEMAARVGLLLRALPLLLWGGLDAQLAAGVGQELRREAEAFLEKYGYLNEHVPRAPTSTQFSNAIRGFQWVSQLPVSGVLDPATLHQMTRPRCGVADTYSQAALTERISTLFAGRWAKMRRKKRFAKQDFGARCEGHSVRCCSGLGVTMKTVCLARSSGWDLKWPACSKDTNLEEDRGEGSGRWPQGSCLHGRHPNAPHPHTLPKENQAFSLRSFRGAVSAAFQLWSNVSALEFWEAPATGPADIRLTFFQGDHNDGLGNAFDGPGGALAHAFLPRRGEAHFDRDERWSLNRRRGRNLFVVLAHEIGHTLGLPHSPAPRALMAPYYKRLGRDALLSWDDVLAVQSLYGKPQRGSVAIQLPGKLFTDFEAWDPHRAQGRRPETQGPKYCHSYFDAITMGNSNCTFFKGATSGRWQLTATSQSPAHYRKGSRCWRFRGHKPVQGSPQRCRAGGLPRHPDAALFFPPLSRLILFKGARYYVLARGGLQVEPYYPRGLQDWGGVPEEVSGALPRPDGSIIFFRDDRYWHLDQTKLRATASGRWATELPWMGCWHANSGGALF